MLAAATDARIALVNDNASGTGGSGLSKVIADGGEPLNLLFHNFPNGFAADAGVDALPYDQHHLLASLAPRPVLLTYARDDIWSKPPGMVRKVFEKALIIRTATAGSRYRH